LVEGQVLSGAIGPVQVIGIPGDGPASAGLRSLGGRGVGGQEDSIHQRDDRTTGGLPSRQTSKNRSALAGSV